VCGVLSRSSVGKWFAQSRAVAYLIPGVCLLLLGILLTVRSLMFFLWGRKIVDDIWLLVNVVVSSFCLRNFYALMHVAKLQKV